MAYDLSDWRIRLRTALGDTAGPPFLWDDDTLDQCTLTAITDHSYLFPQVVRLVASVALGQQEWPLYTATIAVVGVSLAGVPLPALSAPAPAPASTNVSRAVRSDGLPQTFSWYSVAGVPTLRLLQAALVGDVGGSNLVAMLLTTWTLPTNGIGPAAGLSWNGPEADVPLVLLLARRNAYQILAEWQARAQGLTTPTIAGGVTDVHIDIPPILVVLEVEIARAIAARQARPKI